MPRARLTVARLARDGYGSALELLDAPASLVIDLLEHSAFYDDYARTHAELNKTKT